MHESFQSDAIYDEESDCTQIFGENAYIVKRESSRAQEDSAASSYCSKSMMGPYRLMPRDAYLFRKPKAQALFKEGSGLASCVPWTDYHDGGVDHDDGSQDSK